MRNLVRGADPTRIAHVHFRCSPSSDVIHDPGDQAPYAKADSHEAEGNLNPDEFSTKLLAFDHRLGAAAEGVAGDESEPQQKAEPEFENAGGQESRPPDRGNRKKAH